MRWKSGLRVWCQGRLIVTAGKHHLIMPFLIWVGQQDLARDLCGVCRAGIGSWKVAQANCLLKTPLNKHSVTCNALCVGSCLWQWCQKPSCGPTTDTDRRNSDGHGEACVDTSGAGGSQHQLDQLQDQAERRAPSHFARLIRVSWPMDQLKGPFKWAPHSPDLKPCDLCLWDYIKSKVYGTEPHKSAWPAARTGKRCCKRLEKLASKGG